jgi:hypothetical protein
LANNAGWTRNGLGLITNCGKDPAYGSSRRRSCNLARHQPKLMPFCEVRSIQK